jgi:hypothetical protein
VSNTINPTLLNDTYQLVQLARESALAQGKQAHANRLSPVVENLKSLVNTSQETKTASTAATTQKQNSTPAQPIGMMAQSDFQTLLSAAKSVQPSQRTFSSNNISERNQMVRSMAGGNMMDVDIARKMGMTREEVRLIINVNGK